MVKHIILDTDIGCDPDDAFALLLALNSPEIQLDLVVTSDEHEGHRAAFARAMLASLHRDIPVVQGSSLGEGKWCLLDGVVSGPDTPADFIAEMRKIVERNDLTYYVCISPQTNLAAFLEHAPDLAGRLDIVIMGGRIHYDGPEDLEYNFFRDIEAARNVFHSDAKKRYVVSNTTFTPAIAVDQEHRFYSSLQSSAIGDLIVPSMDRFFKRFHPRSMMHDPLTLSAVISGEYVTFETRPMDFVGRGVLKDVPAGKSTTVSVSAQYDEFMAFLGGRLGL